MDIVSIIVGLGFLAIFTVPFLLVRMANNKREKAFMQRFLTIAQSKGLTISDSEIWNNVYVIGIDESSKKLLYLQLTEEGEHLVEVDLSKLSSSSVLRANKKTASNDEVIDRLDLVIMADSKQTIIEFFNSEVSKGLADELKMVEKWKLKLGK